MIVNGMKRCSKCGMTKTIDNFYKNTKLGDGYAYYCKECSRKLDIPRGKKYFQENKEKVQARHLEWNRNNKEKVKEYVKKSQKKHPERQMARVMLNNALKSGIITKKTCEICGSDKNIHAHHENYYKPLEVTWLCAQCHTNKHRAGHSTHGE